MSLSSYLQHRCFRVNDGFSSSASAAISLNVTALPDSDGDGMPNAWELIHFGTTTGGDPALDDDRDGFTNLQEFLANTDPVSAASSLHSISLTCEADGSNTFTWASVGGVRYRVQFSDNLVGGFIDVARPIASELDPAALGASSTQSFIDDFTLTGGAPTQGARFYRVQVVP